jgi:hypothetical protein
LQLLTNKTKKTKKKHKEEFEWAAAGELSGVEVWAAPVFGQIRDASPDRMLSSDTTSTTFRPSLLWTLLNTIKTV